MDYYPLWNDNARITSIANLSPRLEGLTLNIKNISNDLIDFLSKDDSSERNEFCLSHELNMNIVGTVDKEFDLTSLFSRISGLECLEACRVFLSSHESA